MIRKGFSYSSTADVDDWLLALARDLEIAVRVKDELNGTPWIKIRVSVIPSADLEPRLHEAFAFQPDTARSLAVVSSDYG